MKVIDIVHSYNIMKMYVHVYTVCYKYEMVKCMVVQMYLTELTLTIEDIGYMMIFLFGQIYKIAKFYLRYHNYTKLLNEVYL